MTAAACPGCGAAAEITERFTLASTDGPVAHVAVSWHCPGCQPGGAAMRSPDH